MTQYNDNTPLSQLTVGELRDLVRTCVQESVCHRKHMVKGLDGLADVLGCSVSTVKRYQSLLRPAMAKRGRTIVTDADRAIQLWSGRKTF